MYIRQWAWEPRTLCPGESILHTWPHTEDMTAAKGLGFDVTNPADVPLWLHVTLYPLGSGRPEFIGKTRTKVYIAPGARHVEIPFGLFDHSTLVRAHMRFIHRMELSADAPLTVHAAGLYCAGDVSVTADVQSRAAQPGEKLRWILTLCNGLDKPQWLDIWGVRDGRETLTWTVPEAIELPPLGEKQIAITAMMEQRLPEGSVEEKRILLQGSGSSCEVTLFAARKRTAPCLLMKADQWARLRGLIAKDVALQRILEEQYIQPTERWVVPEPAESRAFVYQAYSQHDLQRAVIAWKLTGNAAYLDKVYIYLCGLLDDGRGYFATGRTYFQFIEHESELDCGSFDEHHACSAGWVQEGEFMTQVALAYDLIRYEEWPAAFHDSMERLMRSYMAFEDWRLLDGDGNNFQIVEASAALGFAFVLQDEPMIRRFLNGTNGLTELLGSVLSDDGSYFEGASGYMKLAAEVFGRTAILCENVGRNLKDLQVHAFADEYVMHSPWALRHLTAEDGKPFLGMSFARDEQVTKPTRRLKDYFDQICRMLTPEGVMISCNDGNEHDFCGVMELGYFLYRDPRYLPFAKQNRTPDLLIGLHMAESPESEGWHSHLNTGNGFAMLRSTKDGNVQAVLKFGQHGGYHGHFDRLSLLSLMRDGHTFHNTEYTWYGYDSFLFKMWVQTSVAHNMVVVDDRMQEPTTCDLIHFAETEDYAAACAQTISRWCDPPYGGQTPYLPKFPEGKCAREGRYILPPPIPREQGGIGKYSEPVFQRRLVILVDGVCLVWDVVKAQQEHIFDCLYHPIGRMSSDLPPHVAILPRLNDDPYGAGQFVMNCHQYHVQQGTKLEFRYDSGEKPRNSCVHYAGHAALYLAHPQCCEVLVGHYPEAKDTFERIEYYLNPDMSESLCRKTVAFRQRGTEAAFVTALEISQAQPQLGSVCLDGSFLTLTLKNGMRHTFEIDGMQDAEASALTIRHRKEVFL